MRRRARVRARYGVVFGKNDPTRNTVLAVETMEGHGPERL